MYIYKIGEVPADVSQLQAIFEKLEPNGILIKFMVTPRFI